LMPPEAEIEYLSGAIRRHFQIWQMRSFRSRLLFLVLECQPTEVCFIHMLFSFVEKSDKRRKISHSCHRLLTNSIGKEINTLILRGQSTVQI
jgi:hypothetical protein